MERDRRPRRALLLRRAPRQPRAEPRAAACAARRPAGSSSPNCSAPGSATANAGLVTDIIACPGLDYCALANARSIPIAQRISERFADPARQREIGDLKIKISGCINACGHHHVGHIGILGVDRKGEEFYQITLGGSGDETCSIGEIVGKGFSSDEIVDAVETVVDTYLRLRQRPAGDLPRSRSAGWARRPSARRSIRRRRASTMTMFCERGLQSPTMPGGLLGPDEAIGPMEPILVPLAQFLAERETIMAHDGPFGLVIDAGEDVEGARARPRPRSRGWC